MLKTLNPDFEKDIRAKLEHQEFMKYIDFNVTKIAVGYVEGELALAKKHQQHKGFAHGGLVATIADIVAGFAAVSLVPKNYNVVTAEIKISYFNPGVGDKLVSKGSVVKPGRKLNFCEAEVYAISGEEPPLLIAKASATMATVAPEDMQHSGENQ